ncbi:TetR family transcriptional regulator [Bacillus safensis]|uniref:HTH-type transcriptional repressor AcnR n=1 Tax=Bacillus safensis TaxID=561879 RepID=A0A5C0WJE2_BACIA|nr:MULTISPECIES: TetR/AcrR family transcriptional regulator [Bacillus]MBG9821883.1 TetR family transcriptional regulator [Bacillus safensis]MBG9824850.1 TetR family transcriptional regulator [Bacillus safensis]MBG9834495.1 TetR family transcriptional regulator [Bacillus safensis]MBG9860622.1 TetR family transcriptional regulator [Bacillus safensis]MBG9899437.1 TetR family transcriptional regulator [Bacillus safensis]
MIRQRKTQSERKDETRKLLINSAVENFAKYGFHGVSIDKLAEYAGFSKGAFYAHFHSKEEIFLALLEQQMQLHVEKINALLTEQPSLLHFPEKMNQQSIQRREENRTWSLLNMEFLLYSMRNEEARRQWSNMILQSVKQISQSIEKLINKENLTSTLSSEEMAWTILSLENGIAIFHFISQDHIPHDLLEKSLKGIISSK